MPGPVLVALLVFFLALAVFLALAEASLLRISKFRVQTLEHQERKSVQALARNVEHLHNVLNLILLLALLSQIAAATITGMLAQRWFGNVGVTVASITLTILLFVYGEAIPKTYAVRHAESTALMVSRPISALERVFRPVISALVWVARKQQPGRTRSEPPTVTEDELLLLVGEAAAEGEITVDDRLLIERVFRFGDRRCDEIMVPRPDIVAIQADSSVEEAIELALSSGHRRLPVHTGTLEQVVGVVKLRDLIASEGTEIGDLAQPLLVVPESRRITSLLAEMQETSNHLAVVVDEHGMTVGLVTVEDVAEELLGAITEGPETDPPREVSPGVWSLPGSLPIADLDGIGLECGVVEGDWSTVAGMMVGVAGRLMTVGEEINIGECVFGATSVRRRRITRITVHRDEDKPDIGVPPHLTRAHNRDESP